MPNGSTTSAGEATSTRSPAPIVSWSGTTAGATGSCPGSSGRRAAPSTEHSSRKRVRLQEGMERQTKAEHDAPCSASGRDAEAGPVSAGSWDLGPYPPPVYKARLVWQDVHLSGSTLTT